MSAKASIKDQRMRTRLAQEAARIMLEEGIADFHKAKRKAAARLGAADTRNLPTNVEVEAEIQSHQRLFQADSHPGDLAELRAQALEAMHLLQAFDPRLIGSVLKGTAGRHDSIQLLLYSDTPESVGWRLDEYGIPADDGERKLRFISDEKAEAFPAFRFLAGEHTLELIVLPERRRHQAPLSPSDGQPMERADLKRLKTLISREAMQDQTGLPG